MDEITPAVHRLHQRPNAPIQALSDETTVDTRSQTNDANANNGVSADGKGSVNRGGGGSGGRCDDRVPPAPVEVQLSAAISVPLSTPGSTSHPTPISWQTVVNTPASSSYLVPSQRGVNEEEVEVKNENLLGRGRKVTNTTDQGVHMMDRVAHNRQRNGGKIQGTGGIVMVTNASNRVSARVVKILGNGTGTRSGNGSGFHAIDTSDDKAMGFDNAATVNTPNTMTNPFRHEVFGRPSSHRYVENDEGAPRTTAIFHSSPVSPENVFSVARGMLRGPVGLPSGLGPSQSAPTYSKQDEGRQEREQQGQGQCQGQQELQRAEAPKVFVFGPVEDDALFFFWFYKYSLYNILSKLSFSRVLALYLNDRFANTSARLVKTHEKQVHNRLSYLSRRYKTLRHRLQRLLGDNETIENVVVDQKIKDLAGSIALDFPHFKRMHIFFMKRVQDPNTVCVEGDEEKSRVEIRRIENILNKYEITIKTVKNNRDPRADKNGKGLLVVGAKRQRLDENQGGKSDGELHDEQQERGGEKNNDTQRQKEDEMDVDVQLHDKDGSGSSSPPARKLQGEEQAESAPIREAGTKPTEIGQGHIPESALEAMTHLVGVSVSNNGISGDIESDSPLGEWNRMGHTRQQFGNGNCAGEISPALTSAVAVAAEALDQEEATGCAVGMLKLARSPNRITYTTTDEAVGSRIYADLTTQQMSPSPPPPPPPPPTPLPSNQFGGIKSTSDDNEKENNKTGNGNESSKRDETNNASNEIALRMQELKLKEEGIYVKDKTLKDKEAVSKFEQVRELRTLVEMFKENGMPERAKGCLDQIANLLGL